MKFYTHTHSRFGLSLSHSSSLGDEPPSKNRVNKCGNCHYPCEPYYQSAIIHSVLTNYGANRDSPGPILYHATFKGLTFSSSHGSNTAKGTNLSRTAASLWPRSPASLLATPAQLGWNNILALLPPRPLPNILLASLKHGIRARTEITAHPLITRNTAQTNYYEEFRYRCQDLLSRIPTRSPYRRVTPLTPD